MIRQPIRGGAEGQAPSASPTFVSEAASDGMIVVDRDGVIRTWNAGARRIFGYSRAETCGKSVSLLLLPENRMRMARILSRIRNNPWVEYGEAVCRHKDARPVDISFTALAEASIAPHGQGVCLIIHDTSHRKQFEREMRENLERLETAEQLAQLGSWEWDVSADRLSWSKELTDLLGIDRKLKHATFDRLLRRIRPADRKRFKAGIARSLQDRVPFECRYAVLRPDGRAVELLTRARILEGRSKGRIRLVGTSQDVRSLTPVGRRATRLLRAAGRTATDFRRHALLLAKSAAILFSSFDHESALVKTAKAIVPGLADRCVVELEEGGVVIQLSAAALPASSGRSRPGWVHRETLKAFSRGAPARVRETGDYEIHPVLKPDEIAGILPELRSLSLRPGCLPASALVVPLRSRKGVTGVLLLAQAESKRRFHGADLHSAQRLATLMSLAVERGRLHAKIVHDAEVLREQVAQRTRDLQEALDNLDSYARTVAHDLRAPLRAISGFSQALAEDCADQLGAQGKQHLSRILDGCARMDRFIRDLLTFSQVSRRDIDLQPVDLGKIVEGARLRVEVDLEGRDTRLDVQQPLPQVTANPGILVQVVSNLLSNAVKFVPADRPPVIRLSAERNGDAVRLWVEDNGIGIAPEHTERIFQPFERLNSMETYPGTGLGLTIVRKAMERMNGSVGLESQPGRGSRFWIELPAAEP